MVEPRYGREFYKNRFEATQYAAKTVIELLLPQIPAVNSAVDVGCGVGAWLAVLTEVGVQDVQGFDGDWVDANLLVIAQNLFSRVNLEEPIHWDRRYDLAISLEVAEHISEAKASQFVASLTALSDFILFSAAIPMQGGVGHVNEQPPQYWAALFEERDYVQFDSLRHQIWDDFNIASWYRQNAFLYVKRARSGEIRAASDGFDGAHLVHPESFEDKVGKLRKAQREIRELRGSKGR